MIIIISILIITVLFNKGYRLRFLSLIKEYNLVALILLFILLENLILLNHAINYSFDRMKAVLLLIFIVFLCICTIQEKSKKIITLALIIMAIINVIYYSYNDNYYRWRIDYLVNNKVIAKEITNKYTHENSILVHEKVATRGYSNLLYSRGIYENTKLEQAIEIAKKKNKKYIVLFQSEFKPWNMYDYENYTIYDLDEVVLR